MLILSHTVEVLLGFVCPLLSPLCLPVPFDPFLTNDHDTAASPQCGRSSTLAFPTDDPLSDVPPMSHLLGLCVFEVPNPAVPGSPCPAHHSAWPRRGLLTEQDRPFSSALPRGPEGQNKGPCLCMAIHLAGKSLHD